MRTSENPTHPVGELVCSEKPPGSTTLRLACTHFGSMELSHGLCLGKRQLTILTPPPFSLTSRLCLPSHLLTSFETCQLALSQIRRRTFLPISSSSSAHHERKRVVMELNRRRLSARDRPWRPTAGGGGAARRPRSRHSGWEEPPGSTSTPPRSPPPTRGSLRRSPSVGR
jgi:hypothetical protein